MKIIFLFIEGEFFRCILATYCCIGTKKARILATAKGWMSILKSS